MRFLIEHTQPGQVQKHRDWGPIMNSLQKQQHTNAQDSITLRERVARDTHNQFYPAKAQQSKLQLPKINIDLYLIDKTSESQQVMKMRADYFKEQDRYEMER